MLEVDLVNSFDGSIHEHWNHVEQLERRDNVAFDDISTAWRTLLHAIDSLALISDNEHIDDITTLSLRFVTAPARFAKHLTKCMQMDNRLNALKESIRYSERFLAQCLSLSVLPNDMLTHHKHDNDDDDDDNHTNARARAVMNRQHKIEMLHQKNRIEKRIAHLEKKRNRNSNVADNEDSELSEDERELWILRIHMCARQIDIDMKLSKQEIELLLIRATTQSNESTSHDERQRLNRRDNKPLPLEPLPCHPQVMRINSNRQVEPIHLWPDGEHRRIAQRQRLRDQVFKSSNTPTMSLDELATIEIAAMHNRNAAQTTPLNEEQQQQDNEHNEIDTHESSDRETMKAREWSNWTDDNERGIGNRGVMGGAE